MSSRDGGGNPAQTLHTFSAGEVVYLRTPVLPRDHAAVLAQEPPPAEATSPADAEEDSGPPAEEHAREDERGELTRILRTVAENPLVREALEVSSDSLATTLRRLESGAEINMKQLRRGAFAACRYLLRMTGRPTPFGLMAGVAVGGFVDTAQAKSQAQAQEGAEEGAESPAQADLGPRHAKGVRPDGEWLSALVNELAPRPDVLRCLRVCANDLCFERAGRLVLSYVPQREATDERTNETSVRATAPARIAMTAARTPIPFTELTDRLAAEFPQAGPERVERLLTELVGSGLLCTELSPPQHCTDPLSHVLSVLERTPAPEAERLRTIAELLDSYARAPLGSGRKQWAEATGAMRELRTARTSPVQVDLRLDARLRLPATVAREVERVASVLQRLSPPGGSARHLTDYYWEFLDRYGPDVAVPVKEALDPERGVGPPAGYRLPANSRFTRPQQERDDVRHRRLGELAQQALRSGTGEIVLDERTISALEPDGHPDGQADGQPDGKPSGKPAAPPPTAELNFELLAESLDAVERGDFRLVAAPAKGMVAGGMFGRFAYLFDDDAALTAVMPPPREDVLRAQIAFEPVGGRLANVMRVPTALERTLSIGIFDERDSEHVLGLDDVAIVAERSGLRLVSLRDGRRLTALSPQMLDPVGRTPNAARLLREIVADGTRDLLPWRWGDVDCLPYLPRVRYGRAVLARARWRPPQELSGSAVGSAEAAEWDAALERWRKDQGVPDTVQVGQADRSVELDLNVPLHRRLFRDELRRKPDLVVTETGREGEADLGWLGGHANEIVVPLFSDAAQPDAHRSDAQPDADQSEAAQPDAEPDAHRSTPTAELPAEERQSTPAAPPNPWSPATERQTVPPGGEWVFAKLYSGAERHHEILSDHLPRLLAAVPQVVDRWFFIRYRDPDQHLRLRFHGDPEAMNESLLPRLHSWARELNEGGLIRKLELGSYEPETDRYGGPRLIDAAEHAFRADSEAVLAQLPLRHGVQKGAEDDLPEEVLAALNFVDLLRRAEADWLHWYDETAIRHYDGMHRHVRQAVDLDDELRAAEEHDSGTDGEPAGTLRMAFAHRGPAIAGYAEALRDAHRQSPGRRRAGVESLLHMHHNRLLGIDQEREQRVHAVTGRVVAAHRGRAREGRI